MVGKKLVIVYDVLSVVESQLWEDGVDLSSTHWSASLMYKFETNKSFVLKIKIGGAQGTMPEITL